MHHGQRRKRNVWHREYKKAVIYPGSMHLLKSANENCPAKLPVTSKSNLFLWTPSQKKMAVHHKKGIRQLGLEASYFHFCFLLKQESISFITCTGVHAGKNDWRVITVVQFAPWLSCSTATHHQQPLLPPVFHVVPEWMKVHSSFKEHHHSLCVYVF